MATFYVLPSRLTVGQGYSEFLGKQFPGLAWPRRDWSDLAEMLAAQAHQLTDIHVLFLEDLATDASLDEVLARDFGAEPGDEIIEVRPALRLAA